MRHWPINPFREPPPPSYRPRQGYTKKTPPARLTQVAFCFLIGEGLPDGLGLFQAIGGQDALGLPAARQGHEIDFRDLEKEGQLGDGGVVAPLGVAGDEVPYRCGR